MDRFLLSGLRATFTLKKGAQMDRATIAAALKKNGLKIVRYSQEKRPRDVVAYTAKIAGVG